ncbi:MAG: hypothetical protein AAF465_10060 [Pseudomonadota bacterium]
MTRFAQYLLILTLVFFISSCGGGGGSTPPPPANSAPNAQVVAIDTAQEGAVVSLDGTGSNDPDGDSIAYSWTCNNSSVMLDGQTTSISSFIAPEVESDTSVTCTLTVTDARGAIDSTVVSILIENVPEFSLNVHTLKSVLGYSDRTGSAEDLMDQIASEAGDHYRFASRCWINGIDDPMPCDGYFTANAEGDPIAVHPDLSYGVIINDGSQGDCLGESTYGSGINRIDPEQCAIVLTQRAVRYFLVAEHASSEDGTRSPYVTQWVYLRLADDRTVGDIEIYAPVGDCVDGQEYVLNPGRLRCHNTDLMYEFDDGSIVNRCLEIHRFNGGGEFFERSIYCPGREVVNEPQ